jgi:glutathione peroxidase
LDGERGFSVALGLFVDRFKLGENMTILDVSAKTLEGEERSLKDWQGKVLLIVNVASRCGFTPQYTGLEAIYRRYRERGFEVLGFPCDQFGHQEPGDAQEIRQFCSTQYDVSFPMFAKIEVNGDHTHPLYAQLKSAAKGLLGSESIKWNFTKFLVDRHGRVVKRYAPQDKPESLAADIEALL